MLYKAMVASETIIINDRNIDDYYDVNALYRLKKKNNIRLVFKLKNPSTHKFLIDRAMRMTSGTLLVNGVYLK
jgi:hypothetical protein